jgi:hypothetical protein
MQGFVWHCHITTRTTSTQGHPTNYQNLKQNNKRTMKMSLMKKPTKPAAMKPSAVMPATFLNSVLFVFWLFWFWEEEERGRLRECLRVYAMSLQKSGHTQWRRQHEHETPLVRKAGARAKQQQHHTTHARCATARRTTPDTHNWADEMIVSDNFKLQENQTKVAHITRTERSSKEAQLPPVLITHTADNTSTNTKNRKQLHQNNSPLRSGLVQRFTRRTLPLAKSFTVLATPSGASMASTNKLI